MGWPCGQSSSASRLRMIASSMQLVPPPCLNWATRDFARKCNRLTGRYITSLLFTSTERHKYLLNPCWLTELDSAPWSGEKLPVVCCARAARTEKATVHRFYQTPTPHGLFVWHPHPPKNYLWDRPLFLAHRIQLSMPVTARCWRSKVECDDKVLSFYFA